MFAGEGAVIFFDEVSRFREDGPEELLAFGGFEVDHRFYVQLAIAGMGIHGVRRGMFLQQGFEVGDIVGQVFHRDGAVFDEVHGLGVAFEVSE